MSKRICEYKFINPETWEYETPLLYEPECEILEKLIRPDVFILIKDKIDTASNGVEVSINDYHLTGLKINEDKITLRRVPEEINSLVYLKTLDLSSNKLRTIEGLDNLKELTKLSLSWNEINKIEGLENLKKLKYLKLHQNKITKIEGLKGLINIREVNLSSNHINNPEGLEELPLTDHTIYVNLMHNDIEPIKDGSFGMGYPLYRKPKDPEIEKAINKLKSRDVKVAL